MEKVAEFINAQRYREALARLCRLAQQDVGNKRIRLRDWEITCKNPMHSGHPDKLLDNDITVTITGSEIQHAPLFWLQSLDEHCYQIFGPDNPLPEDLIDDGYGVSKVLPRYPGRDGGAWKGQIGKIARWVKHHHVIPLNDFQGMLDDVADIPQGYKEWASKQFDDESVRIGIVHFCDDACLKITQSENALFFYCEGINNEQRRLESALGYIREAKHGGVHLLVMPELTITPNLRNLIIDELERAYLASGDDHELSVPIIVPGSFHEQLNNKWRNHAKAVLGLDGTTLCKCDKLNPATCNGKGELLDYPAAPLTCIFSPLGLIGMTICKDLFEDSTAFVLHSLSPDWLLVPSMSNSLTPHEAEAEKLFKITGTVVAVANQEMPDATTAINGFVHHGKLPGTDPERCGTGLTIITVSRTDTYLKLVK